MSSSARSVLKAARELVIDHPGVWVSSAGDKVLVSATPPKVQMPNIYVSREDARRGDDALMDALARLIDPPKEG